MRLHSTRSPRGRHARIPDEENPVVNENSSNTTDDTHPYPEATATSAPLDPSDTNINTNDVPTLTREDNTDHDETESLQNTAHDETSVDQVEEEEEIPPDLNQLLVEREYHQRGSSTCTIILILVLLRLWIEAIFTADVALIIISSFMTSYLIAWRNHRASVENELNAQIEAVQRRATEERENGEAEESGARLFRRVRGERSIGAGTGTGAGSGRMRTSFDGFDFSNDHIDLEMLGFQAQLAFAIMESQRNMMEGGYGRPGGEDETQLRGVRDETRAQWEAFSYDANDAKVRACSDLKPHKNELPSCCICLCEYEKGEMLNQLRCNHVYHKECIDSWCENHVRCPLCNSDLEDTSCDSIV